MCYNIKQTETMQKVVIVTACTITILLALAISSLSSFEEDLAFCERQFSTATCINTLKP